jgi:hypothetical protein
MFFGNVCPSLICEPNGYTLLGHNQIDHRLPQNQITG